MSAPGGQLVKPVRARHRAAARAIHLLVRLLGATWRFEIVDHAGIGRRENAPPPFIWVFWHNRVLVVPPAYRRHCPHRHGSVLTSPSDDGAILAETMRLFHCNAVRGSTSKRGGRALIELERVLRAGGDVVITPDGPRGPRYRMSVGVPRLAARSGCRVLPVGAEFSRCWRLRSWDGFAIPMPFATVSVTFGRPLAVAPDADIEEWRLHLERVLRADMIMQ